MREDDYIEKGVQVKFLWYDGMKYIPMEDFAWMRFSNDLNCCVFHTMAFGWLTENEVISWKEVDAP